MTRADSRFAAAAAPQLSLIALRTHKVLLGDWNTARDRNERAVTSRDTDDTPL